MEYFQFASPQLLFFLSFYVAFTAIELLMIWGVTRLELKHWEYMIDKVIRFSVHHGRKIKWFFYAFLLIFLAIFFQSFHVWPVLKAATLELQIFSLLMVLTIGLIYFRTVHKHARLSIDLKIQTYIFLLISGFLFMFMIRLADQTYGRYEQYVNTMLVDPAVREVRSVILDKHQEEALNRMREKVRKGECSLKDFSEETEANLIQLVYLTTDAEFITSFSVADPSDPMSFLKGYLCEDGNSQYLLTFSGAWYAVELN